MEFIKNILRRIIFRFLTHPADHIKNSYSQAGEDTLIKFLFDSKKISQPDYLDLGTFLPDFHNNTYLFYKLGARGVLVEADSSLIDKIKHVRPEDRTLNIGVGLSNSCSEFYIFNEPALNTFNKEEADSRERQGTYKIVKTSSVLIKSINFIIEENFSTYPKLLSIDLEGLDVDVLKSLDFKRFPIPVICAETCLYSENHIKEKNHELIKWMISNNYFVYGDTYINTVFVNREWFLSNS